MTRLTQRLPVLFLALLASSLAHADSAHLQVVQAVAGKEAEGRGEYVDVTFTPGSRGPLAEFTRARVGKRVEFRVDDQVLTVVTVQGAIETSGLRLSAGGSGFGGKSAADIERILEPGTYVEVADAGKAESDRVPGRRHARRRGRAGRAAGAQAPVAPAALSDFRRRAGRVRNTSRYAVIHPEAVLRLAVLLTPCA